MKKALLPFLFTVILFSNSCKKSNDDAVGPGTSSREYLSSQNYDKLRIEIQSVSGFEPSSASITALTNFLEQRLNKPAGIEVIKTTIPSPGKAILTLSDIKSIEQKNRTQQNSGKTITAYFLVVDADYSENTTDEGVLGIAYSPSAMVLFEKTIKDHSSSDGFTKPRTAALETNVLEHEFGHILGLVNNGTGMQTNHQDEANGKHCNNKDCLMYYEAESSSGALGLMSRTPTLDANCLADLKANGGK